MQQRRAMAVQHALGIAGGAGCVAQRGRGVLVELGPVEIVVLGGEQLFVAEQVRDRNGRHVRAVGHRDPALDALACRSEPFDERRERQVEEAMAILGMIDDVSELVGKQARIDGVDHRARAGHRVIELEVAIAVPRERADAIARLHAQARQCAGEAARADVGGAIGVTVDRAFDGARHDLGVAVVAIRVADQRRDHQRLIHHQAEHDSSFGPMGEPQLIACNAQSSPVASTFQRTGPGRAANAGPGHDVHHGSQEANRRTKEEICAEARVFTRRRPLPR